MEKCLICDSEVETLENDKIIYKKCGFCGFLKKSDEYILSNEEEKKRYDSHVCDEGYFKYMEKIFNTIKPYLNGTCLDFGSGKINLLESILKRNGFSAYSYDKYYFNSDYKIMKYDSIILIEVFEHIDNPLKTLESLKELLNNNGNIIIMTNLYKDLKNWWYLRDKTHISFYNEDTFKVIAEKLNMKLIINGNLICLFS